MITTIVWQLVIIRTDYKFIIRNTTGADPVFQVKGGALKKIALSGGRCENILGISCEKSRFYAKKSYQSVNKKGYEYKWT